ncbi:MAG: [NiFe]-hydrogenase assembly chaperone HybE [Gammaproteobacteria bacterium]|nr:[NiFe]-hydrogenase assembly chaperone HybE [Gammaproteobacteria bacterium]
MVDVAPLVGSVQATFEGIHERVFSDDPATNSSLHVEVVEAVEVEGVGTLILIAPWTLIGMLFAGEENYPTELTIASKTYTVLTNSIDGLGTYGAVNLVRDILAFETQEQARMAARSLAEPFSVAVRRAYESAAAPDPDRRRFLGL